MTMASANGDDLIQPFRLEAPNLRGRLVRLGSVPEAVIGAHRYPKPVANLLGETLALAAALAGALKFDGVFTLQTKGDGPVSMMVADVTSDGEMRGYAQFDEDKVAALTEAAGGDKGATISVPRLLGAGYLAFTVDQGPDTERYQGIVELEGATLAECAHKYFRQSEQIETGIRLAAGRRKDGAKGSAWRAGAMVLQRMPPSLRAWEAGPEPAPEARPSVPFDEESEEDWRRALILMGSVTDDELLDPDLDPNDVLYRVFHEEMVRVYRPKPLSHHCRCSAQRVRRMLAAIPRHELDDLKIDGKVVVTCQFCNAEYVFDDAALDEIYGP